MTIMKDHSFVNCQSKIINVYVFLGESFDWKVMVGAAMIIAGGLIIVY
jgi:drug/metabolite transporter (DMT)-like permease